MSRASPGLYKVDKYRNGEKMTYKPKNRQKFIDNFFIVYSNQLHVSAFYYNRISLKYNNLKS